MTTTGEAVFTGGLIVFLIRAAFIILFAWLINKGLQRAIRHIKRRSDTNDMLLAYTSKIIAAIIYTIAAFSILSGIVPLQGFGTALLGATSVISVIIGLAAQETFGNFIAGFFLAFSQPFSVGDLITLPEKGITGTVQEITFRHTVLQTIENSVMIIPNSLMNTAVLENKVFGQTSYTRFIKLSVAYDSDIDLVKKVITKVVMATPGIIDTRSEEEKKAGAEPIHVRLSEFKDSGIEITFPVTAKNLGDNYMASSAIREGLLKEFRANGIVIPYQTVQILK